MYELLKPSRATHVFSELLVRRLRPSFWSSAAASPARARLPSHRRSVPPRATATAQAPAPRQAAERHAGSPRAGHAATASAYRSAACDARRPAQPTLAGQVDVGELAAVHRHRRATASTRRSTVHRADRHPGQLPRGHQRQLRVLRHDPARPGAGQRSTGYDIITPSDWMVAKLIRLGYLQPLDKSLLPNFDGQRAGPVQEPVVRPGQRLLGAVAVGHRRHRLQPKLTGREITSFDDLLDPAFNGNVGMFSEMIDTMCLALLSTGHRMRGRHDRRRSARPSRSC